VVYSKKVKGLVWNGEKLEVHITNAPTEDMMEKYRICGYPPINHATIKTKLVPHGGHADLRYLSDLCEASSIGRIRSSMVDIHKGNVILDIGAKLSKDIIDRLLDFPTGGRDERVKSIIKIRPCENEYDKQHWAYIEKDSGWIPDYELFCYKPGVYLFKGTLQEFAGIDTLWSSSKRTKMNKFLKDHTFQILLHDCHYYFDKTDIKNISKKINIGWWHVSGMEYCSFPIKTTIF